MSIPQLSSSICGCSLKTGSKIIGWLSLIANIISLIVFATGLATLYYIEEHPGQIDPRNKDILEHLPVLKFVAIIVIIIHTIGSGVALILLLGIYQSKAKLVLIWVLIALTSALIEQVANLVQIFTIFQPMNLFNVLLFLVDLYFILIVYSFYREIQNVGSYA